MTRYDIDTLMKIIDPESNGLINDSTYQKFKELFLDVFDSCDSVLYLKYCILEQRLVT